MTSALGKARAGLERLFDAEMANRPGMEAVVPCRRPGGCPLDRRSCCVYIHSCESGAEPGRSSGDEWLRVLRPPAGHQGGHSVLRLRLETASPARHAVPDLGGSKQPRIGAFGASGPRAGDGPDDAPQERPPPCSPRAGEGRAGCGLTADRDPSDGRWACPSGAGLPRLEASTSAGSPKPRGIGLVAKPGHAQPDGSFGGEVERFFCGTKCAYAHVRAIRRTALHETCDPTDADRRTSKRCRT